MIRLISLAWDSVGIIGFLHGPLSLELYVIGAGKMAKIWAGVAKINLKNEGYTVMRKKEGEDGVVGGTILLPVLPPLNLIIHYGTGSLEVMWIGGVECEIVRGFVF